MSFVVQTVLVLLLALVAVKAFEAVARLVARSRSGKKDLESPSSPAFKPTLGEKDAVPYARRESPEQDDAPSPQPVPDVQQNSVQDQGIQLHKDLYFKVQNLEDYPDALLQCWTLLISLFSETLDEALRHRDSGILSVQQYTQEDLVTFLQTENEQTTQQWESYVARRRAGAPREMFRDREEAEWWLKQAAPVKYVDGAWLGHINKITTPFALRRITKNAWQVMSEELGDGDLSKNHVHVYRDLMKDISSGLPEGDTADFIHPRHGLNESRVWKAAIAQLLISLFPYDFLPEILGFNMAYENLPLHLMKTVKELEELKLNAYYFVLHIAIDNAASGHAAMAVDAAAEYIDHMRTTYGDEAAAQTWKRVQAGFILAEGLPTTPESPSMKKPREVRFPRDDTEATVADIFKAKAAVAHKIHCNSRLRIGRHSLVQWLEPRAFEEKTRQMQFLHDLANCRPWVIKGSSAKSRLIRELTWEGKMFGSFTQTEVEVVKRWIDDLGASDFDEHVYWTYTGREEITSNQRLSRHQDVRCDYPVLADDEEPSMHGDPGKLSEHTNYNPSSSIPVVHSTLSSPLGIGCLNPDMSKFVPIWFAHPCLLEGFVSIPAKVANKVGSAIVRVLRAQSGFETEGPGVAGMDEVRRTDVLGLVEVGLEMLRIAGLPEPKDLKEAMEGRDEAFARLMLHYAMKPMQNMGLLLGLSWAFAELHEAMAESELLTPTNQAVLRHIGRRERESLAICREEIEADEILHAKFQKGYNLGRAEILHCFHTSL